jgi:membrane-bound lytic murein transglycosylase MltF
MVHACKENWLRRENHTQTEPRRRRARLRDVLPEGGFSGRRPAALVERKGAEEGDPRIHRHSDEGRRTGLRARLAAKNGEESTLMDLPSLVSHEGQTASARNASLRSAEAITLAALLSLCALAGSCQSGSRDAPASEPTKKDAAAPAAPQKEPAKEAAQPAAPADEDIPPILKTPWKGDLDEMAKRRIVRVLTPFRRPEFFYMEGRPAGILQEVFQEVEKILNARYKTTAANRIVVALLPAPIDRLRERMEGGYGDIAAASISITEEHKQIADFTIPTMTGLKIVVVTGPGAPELKTVEDLSGKEVWVMPQTRMKKDLEDLNARLKSQGKAPAKMREADTALEPGDVMEMVNAGIYPITLMQSVQAEFWAQVFDQVKPRKDLALAEDVQVGWAIQKGTPQLKAFLDGFISTHGIGTSFGNTLVRRYLKEAKYVRNATQEYEMKKFHETLPYFKKYSAQYSLDYLLLAAQGYQESRLDQSVKSRVGAVGIMQVMPSTAAAAPVKVPNIETEENNINAGARLLHFLIEDHFNEPGLTLVNRMLFALASYNAGPQKIARCRTLAKDMGYDPNIWFNNVEVAAAKVIGRETTQYVANIYKYYVCYRLAGEAYERREAARKETMKSQPAR